MIRATVPGNLAIWHRELFRFCRMLKSLPALGDAGPDELLPILRRWHQAASSVLGELSFTDVNEQFAVGWPEVEYPAGEGPFDQLWRRAQSEPVPAAAAKYDDERVQRLIAFCRVLQEHASGDRGAFYLSCRTVGHLFGVDHKKAWRWLRMLVFNGLLEVVSVGKKATGNASEYRYRGQ